MAENSAIEWTDHTFNPWRGCTKVSPGCAHCYAETLSKRNPKVLGEWGKGKPRVLASASMWKQPLKWNREAEEMPYRCLSCGERCKYEDCTTCEWEAELHRPRVFCASLADWLDNEVPIGWLANLLALIAKTPHLDWLLLTKRPQNWRERIKLSRDNLSVCKFALNPGTATRDQLDRACCMLNLWLGGTPPENVWIGTTVEDQQRADERIPELLKIPARVRFLSCEPLLQAIDLRRCCHCGETEFNEPNEGTLECSNCGKEFGSGDLRGWGGESMMEGIHWLIAGGESGPDARPMHPNWARSLRDQCAAAGVPFLFKQWGEWIALDAIPHGGPNEAARALSGAERYISFDGTTHAVDSAPCSSYLIKRLGKKAAGRLLDGIEHNGFPNAQP